MSLGRKRDGARHLKLRVLTYVLCFALVLGLISSGLYILKQQRRNSPDPAGDLPGKTAFYLRHAKDYDLVFLGDSRTYCAVHPEMLDPLLGTRSFNLAHWAHWLPTQYAHLQDVLPTLPPRATIVWSVGELNFWKFPIIDKYPLGLSNAWRLLVQGYTAGELAENILTFNPATFLYAYRGVLLERAQAVFARPLVPAGDSATTSSQGEPGNAKTNLRTNVLRTEVQLSDGRPVAVSRFMAGGSYLLEELDPAHFRARQMPLQAADVFSAPVFAPEPSRWATFLAMLDLCREGGVHLVVNVLEEAPHRYPDQAQKRIRTFMDSRVRQEVESRGFVYLRTDLDRLSDADYFDYDHLNERGAEKYSRLLAEALRPHLPKAGRP